MELVTVGYVRRAHGLRGAVVVRPTTDRPDERFVPGAVFDTEAGPLEIERVGPHRDGLLVVFVGISDRNAAEGLRGLTLEIPLEARRDLEPGEYWPDELVGCEVVDAAGRRLGEVVDVVLGGSQDRLVVGIPEGDTVEVPFVDALVPHVDVDARRVVVEPPEGLFPPESAGPGT
ncbi:MAG TPA: ribosome maturation factor RimM [Actinobacteria bacterium]|nr:ribosome maturation factor RimM [Actinomycetota bacterium]